MKVQRPTTEPKKPTPPKPPSEANDEDVEGHVMNMPAGMALDLARAREREVRVNATRHPLIAAAKERARRKR